MAANLLKTVDVKPNSEVGIPFSPLYQWVDYFSRAFRALAKAMMQVSIFTCLSLHAHACVDVSLYMLYLYVDGRAILRSAGAGKNVGGQGRRASPSQGIKFSSNTLLA